MRKAKVANTLNFTITATIIYYAMLVCAATATIRRYAVDVRYDSCRRDLINACVWRSDIECMCDAV